MAAFPIIFRHELEALDWRYVAPLLGLAGSLAAVEFLYDRAKEKKLKAEHDREQVELRRQNQDAQTELRRENQAAQEKLNASERQLEEKRHRIEHLRETGVDIGAVMSRLVSTMLKIEKTIEGVGDQVADPEEAKKRERASPKEAGALIREAIASTDEVIVWLLKAVATQVAGYWGKHPSTANSNLMLARRVKDSGPAEVARLKDLPGLKTREFVEFGRTPESYDQLLELVCWGTPDAKIPALVLPVEGPDSFGASSADWRDHLIPGAPTALALGQDEVVSDTLKIEQVFRPGLEQRVRRKIVEYFQDKAVRSFVCMFLGDGVSPIGVLNIEATWPDICGPEGSEKDNLTKSIDHYRFCLLQVIKGQRRLRGLKI